MSIDGKKQQSQANHIRKGVWVHHGEGEGNRVHHGEEEGNRVHREVGEGSRGGHEEAEEEPFSQIKDYYEDACVVFS